MSELPVDSTNPASRVTYTRTITWEDPTPAIQAGMAMSGLEYLKALQAGDFPPPPIGS